MKEKIFVLALTLITVFALSSKAQHGCQDPLATNFNSSATATNSSCIYSVSSAPLANRIASLPSILDETSALLFTDGKVFTINDSGNSADIFQFDSTTGQIIKTTRISNHSNIDWEDLAADSSHIYVGDFGNNNGDRTNLRILKIRKSAVYHPDSLDTKAEKLSFNYPDQSSFISGSTHNFDCESVFFWGGRLHLFSKNRGNRKTKHYSLNPNLSTQTAVLHDSLNTNGLITSASVSSDGKAAVLLGYDQSGTFPVFVWILFGFDGSNFFGGNRRRIELPGFFTTGQAEGIGFVSQSRLWVSNERFGNIPPRVNQLNIASYINPFFTGSREELPSAKGQFIFPNPAFNQVLINLKENESYQIVNALGGMVAEGNNGQVDLSNMTEGLYFVSIFKQGKPIRGKNQTLMISHK